MPKGFSKITISDKLKERLRSTAEAEGLGMPDLILRMLEKIESEHPVPEETGKREEKPHIAHSSTSIECGSRTISIGSTYTHGPNLYLTDEDWPVGTTLPVLQIETDSDFDKLWDFVKAHSIYNCPKCGSMDTRCTGTDFLKARFECAECRNVFYPLTTDAELEAIDAKIDLEMKALKKKETCPKCGSEDIHGTKLHECVTEGTPMKCYSCYHTWCATKEALA